MKKVFTALFSLFSVTGGHVVHRRWDRALFFFALLLLWVSGGWVATSWLVMPSDIDDATAMMQSMTFLTNIILVGIVLLMLASAITTWRETPGGGARSVSGMIGGGLVSLLSLVVIGTQVFSAITLNNFTHMREGQHEGAVFSSTSPSFSSSGDHFNEHIYYGRPARESSWGRQDVIENGDGIFVVGISYQHMPAEGVELKVTFDNGKQTDWATTDSAGRALFKVPVGEYVIKSLRTRRWSGKPDGLDVYLDSGLSPKVGKGFYWPHRGYMDQDGQAASVSQQHPPRPQLSASIRDHILMAWPPQGDKETQATLADDTIRWDEVSGASKYRVQLSEVSKDGERSTSYRPVIWHDTDQTRLPLSTLPTVSSTDDETHYTTRIFAFDADGSLIATSPGMFSGGEFVLKDQRRFPDMQSLSLTSTDDLDQEQLELIELDRKRLRAVDTLIDDGFYDAARKLLDLVSAPSLATRKACAIGYLLSKQGDCDAAREAFAELTLDNPDYVIPQRYLNTCSALQ